MTKKMQIKLNGRSFDVEVESASGNSVNLNVNGKKFEVEIEDSGSSIPQPALQPIKSTPAAAANKPAEPTTPSATVAAPSSDVIIAPMPGVIMDISVKAGDNVTVKQQICALEAMKMKNIIRSSRDGVVASVEVTDGQHVPYGAVIIRFA